MRWLCCAVSWLVLAGCHAFQLDVEGRISERAAQPIDASPPAEGSKPLPVLQHEGPLEQAGGTRMAIRYPFGARDAPAGIVQVGAVKSAEQPGKDDKAPKSILQRLTPPEGLLGTNVPDIALPGAGASQAEKDAAIKKQFPPLPALPKLPEAKPGPNGRALSLTDLQQLALKTSPQIRQAHQDVAAARGAALQAGLYPNPSIGYEGSTTGQGNNVGNRSPGQQGGFVEQTLITAGKLTIARAAAEADVRLAEQKLKQVEADLQAQVRAGYFAVLAAQKNFETTRSLAQLAEELYNVLLLQLQAGEVAAYEPMQVRVLAVQARGSLAQAYNRHVAAWKQLAASLGTPEMPLMQLEGKVDMPVPHFEREQVLHFVLANHTEVVSAQVGVEKARLLTRLAEVQPYPDVTVHLAFQRDFTTPPFGTVANINVGVPVPFFNRNQGNIQAARAQLERAVQDSQRVRNELSGHVAGAFERYDNNRVLLELYKKQILPNQVQAFRAAVARHAAVGDKGVSYNDLVTAQQTLASLINNYLGALSDQWTAVIDIGRLLQTRDLFQTQPLDEVAPLPDVHELLRPRHRR